MNLQLHCNLAEEDGIINVCHPWRLFSLSLVYMNSQIQQDCSMFV